MEGVFSPVVEARIKELMSETKAFQAKREAQANSAGNAIVLLDITINQLPPSVNEIYATVNGRRVKSAKGRAFTNTTIELIHAKYTAAYTIPKEYELELFLVCYYPSKLLYSRNDSDNRLKAVKDAAFKALNSNDSRVVLDHPGKVLITDPAALEKYPGGYCRVLITKFGYADQVLKRLGLIKAA